MQVQSNVAYPRFGEQGKSKPHTNNPKEPLRNIATISYTELTPAFKKDQKTFLSLLGGSMGLMLGSQFYQQVHQSLKKVVPSIAKKVSPETICLAGITASLGSFLGAGVKCVGMSKHTKQFTLNNVDLHALRGGDAQQLQSLG